jgi:heme/copper-type cytochrome/quinol oxidase subunit 2
MIDTLRFDFNLNKKRAWFYTVSLPLILFIFLEILDIASFTSVLGIGGVISGGLTAILILFMVGNAKRKGDRLPEYSIPYSRVLTYTLIAIFIIGAILQIIYSI